MAFHHLPEFVATSFDMELVGDVVGRKTRMFNQLSGLAPKDSSFLETPGGAFPWHICPENCAGGFSH